MHVASKVHLLIYRWESWAAGRQCNLSLETTNCSLKKASWGGAFLNFLHLQPSSFSCLSYFSFFSPFSCVLFFSIWNKSVGWMVCNLCCKLARQPLMDPRGLFYFLFFLSLNLLFLPPFFSPDPLYGCILPPSSWWVTFQHFFFFLTSQWMIHHQKYSLANTGPYQNFGTGLNLAPAREDGSRVLNKRGSCTLKSRSRAVGKLYPVTRAPCQSSRLFQIDRSINHLVSFLWADHLYKSIINRFFFKKKK